MGMHVLKKISILNLREFECTSTVISWFLIKTEIHWETKSTSLCIALIEVWCYHGCWQKHYCAELGLCSWATFSYLVLCTSLTPSIHLLSCTCLISIEERGLNCFVIHCMFRYGIWVSESLLDATVNTIKIKAQVWDLALGNTIKLWAP